MARLLEATQKFVGTEPTWKGVDPKYIEDNAKDLINRTLGWYSSECSRKDSLEWLEKAYPEEKFKFALNAGFLCRMISRGFPKHLLEDHLNDLLSRLPRIKKESPKKKVEETHNVGIAFKPIDLSVDKYGEMIDYAIDDFLSVGKTQTKIKVSGLSKKQLEALSEFVQKYITEFSGCSKREGYDNINQRLENHIVGFLSQVMQQIQQSLPAQPERKQRAKKLIPVEKIVKNFIATDFGKFKTISPSKLHRCTAALLFDSKIRKVTLLIAKNDELLEIKSKAVINYDEEKSFSKLLRKPEQQLDLIVNSTKNNIAKKLQEIRSVDGPPKNRCSDTTTILKVW